MNAKNENRPGYKKTKVGWIPLAWECVRVSQATTYVDYRGKTPPKSTSGTFLVTAKNVQAGFIDYRVSQEYIPDDKCAEVMSRGRAAVGDILITTEAPLGNVAMVDREDIALAQRVIKYRADSEKLNDYFLMHCMLGAAFQLVLKREATGGTVRGIKGSRLHKLYLPLPPLPEQKAIARVLQCWDRAIRGYERKIEKKRNVKKGLMQQLLSGKQRLPGFSGEWKKVRLGSSGSFSKGKGIAKDDVAEKGLPCIRYGQIYTTDVHIATQLPSRVSLEVAQQSTRIGYNDLLLAGSGETIDEIGKSLAYMGTEVAYAGGDIVIFSAQAGTLRADYLAYYLNTEGRRSVRRIGQGQSVVHVYARDLMNVVVPLPAVREQQAIAAVISDADAEVEALERKLAILKEQKRFLLNNLVTGSLRLPEFCNHGKHGMTQK